MHIFIIPRNRQLGDFCMVELLKQLIVTFLFQRCIQPAQQQGRRIPLLSSDSALSILMPLVSTFLPEVTQQIHSLRASGVISSHTESAFESEASAPRKSVGNLCTTPVLTCLPVGMVFFLIIYFYHSFDFEF